MGFRSEIFIVIDNKLVDEFYTLLKEHDLDTSFNKLSPDEQNIDNATKFYGDWLKWYDSYKDVKAVNSFVDDNYEVCALLGIGEDGSESARCGSPDMFEMYVVSTIEW